MQQVTDGVWLDNAAASTDEQSIGLVIIFGWMDANVRHLEKYGQWYRTEKNLSVMYVESRQPDVLRSAAATARVLEPVRTILAEYGVVAGDSAKATAACFVHVFSDGGSRSLKSFTDFLHDVHQQTLVAAGIVFDSCPGQFTVTTAVRSFAAPIRNLLLRPTAVGLLYVFFSALRLIHFVTFSPDATEKTRRALLEPSRFGQPSEAGSLAPRLYQYSESDQLILYQAVEAHAEAARQSGASVTLKKWENTPHVRHMQADPGRYWAAVAKLYEEAEQHAAVVASRAKL
ncbi:hypothetical protein BDZ88DRAFT_429223 [Geranomyces variabilis]|nr:hypothetical protein BDZ88DRAFT_429223 [Geranomyces variabilis]KAJ3136503.1 hypothetical protein HDU90_003216 [Geranomyces variabilis]